ncbi:MAG: hypothetical protein P4M06_17365 [Pandoraea sp.]|nr:hypothetical protein [Pandoraea sp.]MDR3399316.1 hypothetical protein [Pandoraea sp.]
MSLARSTLLVMISRILVMFAGLIVSGVAAHALSSVEQGYFFTFLSIAAAQALFELGITNLILHHLSHARAAIAGAVSEADKKNAVDIAESARAYSKRYFLRAAGLFTVVVGLGGLVFFYWSPGAQGVHWQMPWTLMIAGTALSLFNLTHYSHLEGFGRLAVSYRIRMTATVVLIAAFTLAAFTLGGLMSYPLALLASNGYACFALHRACTEVNKEFGLGGGYQSRPIDIGREQRKMAVSATAGYVTANTLTPYAFHFFGAEVAGQIGLTMSIFAAIATVAMARTTAEAPTYGPLIASGKLTELKRRFRSTFAFSVALAVALVVFALIARQMGLAMMPKYDNRVLGVAGFVVIGLLIVSNVALSVTSTVLRAFKIEQLMWPSLFAALLVLLAQLALRLDPVKCLAVLAAFNGLVFYPFAHRRLAAKISI